MSSVTSYRSQPAQLSDSDSSASDDEDQPWKRQKKSSVSKRETPMVVSSIRESALPSRGASSSLKRKRNNIWADVVQEQGEEQVARDITQFDMYSSKERDVESYSYQSKEDNGTVKQQPLGNPIMYDDNAANKNRKIPEALGGSNDDAWLVDGGEGNQAGVKDRLGSRDDIQIENDTRGIKKYENGMKYVKLESVMHKKEVAGKIAYSLQEPKRDMVKIVVDELGVEKAIAVWNETWELENSGGMMVNNGSRRRTPGGVFFQLLKTDSDIPQATKDVIFAMSSFQSRQEGKSRRKRIRRKHRMNVTDTNQTGVGDGDILNLENDEEGGMREEENRHGIEEMGEGIKKEEEGESKDDALINKVDRTMEGTVAGVGDVGPNSEIKEKMDLVKTEYKVQQDDMEEGEISD